MYAHLNEDWENNGTKVFLNSNSAIVMQKTLFKLLGNYKVPLYRSSRHLEFAFLGEQIFSLTYLNDTSGLKPLFVAPPTTKLS